MTRKDSDYTLEGGHHDPQMGMVRLNIEFENLAALLV